MTPDDMVALCRESGVRLVRFLYCDNGGVIRGKAVHVDRLAARLRTGVGITTAMLAMNSLDQLQDVEGMGPVGEVRLVADPQTFTVLPYAPASAALVCDHFGLEGRPDPAGPRTFLSRMTALLAQRGMELWASVENEFSLARREDGRWVPVDTSLCFSTVGMTASAGVTDAIVEALGRQGIPVEQYYAELGHGQQELSVSPRTAVRAADTQVLVRETIRSVAAAHGLVASMAPKPWPDQAGNGAHVHFSLWDLAGQRNFFHDPAGRYGLSHVAERFVAGVLAHLPGLLALTAPSYNSYQRLGPQRWTSACTCWGPDNREASVRVPSTYWGIEASTTNLEYKPADTSSNPYLAFGGLIAAGLDGIERDLVPPEPVTVDPATLTDEEREAGGMQAYPGNLKEALDALEADEVLMGALGDPLARAYLAVRRSEWEAWSAADEGAVFEGHFLKY
jgi:glutamine synthetase